ncbi:hypothetical protein CORMATOL_00283 [Corynebacterium matruchotii ATCC 33806]|jgi:hypothetical protein|uniref:Uncharacterized protein n=1 Tax=Corynebacterium matruchotii ATCC 33806 TaxID=566549 RepID=C0DZY7_9CORY|nr:hypothetical protein CORMATOL_00283 [Corynebacterium matruchotii ATCC 33806]
MIFITPLGGLSTNKKLCVGVVGKVWLALQRLGDTAYFWL